MSEKLAKEDVLFLQRLLKCAGFYAGILDGFWGSKTDAAVAAFEAGGRALRDAFGELDARSEIQLQRLHPKAQAAARTFIAKVRGGGMDARILSGTRTYAEQNALFRQGRFGNPGKIVTNARGGQSNHNFGIAWDIGLFKDGKYLTDAPPYKKAAEIGLTEGLEWGGNWITFQDWPHYQLTTGLAITDLRKRFEAGEAFV